MTHIFLTGSLHRNRRLAPHEFARRTGLGDDGFRAQHGATGLVRCGNATGTGQLTLRNNIITTAAHVLIAENGQRRNNCVFEPMTGAGAGCAPSRLDRDWKP